MEQEVIKLERLDYEKEKFQNVSVRDIECEFNDMRIDPNTIPEGKYKYEVAGDDDCGDEPARVQQEVFVNFFGTLVSNEPLPIGDDGVLWLNDDDFKWL